MAVVGSAEFEVRARRDRLAKDIEGAERDLKTSLDRQERDAEKRFARVQRSRGRMMREVGDAIGRIGTGSNATDVLSSKGPAVLEAMAAGGARASASMVGLGVGLSAAAAGVLLLAAAWQKGEQASLEFERAATGVGRTAGLTGDQLEALTVAAAEQGEVSIKAAREQAVAYLQTGQIGGEAISRLIELGKDYASFMGIEAAEATRQLAKAMLDPLKAGRDMTDQFGLLDQAQLKQIDTMIEAGDLMGAQRVLFNQLDKAVEGHAGQLGLVESAWDAIGRAISDVIDKAGRALYVTEGERLQQIINRRSEIERGQRANGRPLDARTQGVYDNLGRDGGAILARRQAQAATAAQARANQDAERARRLAEERASRGGGGGGGRRARSPALTQDNQQTLRDLSARREALTIEGQIAVLRAQGRNAEAEAGQRRLDVLNLTRTFEAAGFEDAKALAEAQVASIASAEARQRGLNAAQEQTQRWLSLAVDAQRSNASLALERLQYEAEIASLTGDPKLMAVKERELFIAQRVNDLLRDKKGLLTGTDIANATAQATREADVYESADREGRLRDEFRRSFVDGMRAAIDGDVGGLFESLADRFTDRLLEGMADDLFDLLKGGKEGASFIGSILGGLKSMIPGFAGGVDNFGGGLAYVHKGEVLTNLSAGTSVIPAHAVRAMGGASGASSSGRQTVRVMVVPNDDRFDAYVDGRSVPAAGAAADAAFSSARQVVPSDMAQASRYSLSRR